MYYFNSIITKILGLLLAPFLSINPLWSLLVLSALTGILMLLAFGRTSNQEKIRQEKDKIKAHLMEMRIFKDDLPLLMSAFLNVLFYNARYMKHLIKPMLVLIIPMVILLIHLNSWYGYRPLKPGESTILSVKIDLKKTGSLSKVNIEVDKGLVIDAPPLRIQETGEINWRIKAKETGVHIITVKAGGESFQKRFVVSEKPLALLSPLKVGKNFWDVLLNPGEKPLSKNAPVKEIGINYSSAEIDFFGWQTHWLVVFFILSMVAGFACKGFFKVEI